MKMVNSRFTFNLFLTLLLSVNSIFMLLYLYKMTNNDDSGDSRYQNSNKLTLDLEIMDIYRLDISCDYITQALAEKISSKYKNKNKKCSLSSLDPNINELISKSVNQTSTHYAPLFNVSATLSFDPYDMNSEVNQKKQYPQFQSLQLGGNWLPSLNQNRECNHNDLDSIVFIVPFSKSRLENLKLFLINIHSYLQSVKYKFNYRIIVAEQEIKQNDLFNKGRLINRAVKYALDSFKHIDCLVIHDVDLVPSNNQEFILKEKGDYRCRQMPWHLSNEVYSLSRKESRVYNKFLTGGILSLRPAHFINSNGFSNMYFGWGAEGIFELLNYLLEILKFLIYFV